VTSSSTPAVSVILPTRNRATLLGRTLESLGQQTLPVERFEIIVVDNGSSDGTEEVARAAAARLPQLRYLRTEEPGLHVARHAGLRAARSEVLLFGDDDIRAAASWVEAIADCFTDHRVGVAGGRCLPDFETEPPGWIDQLWTRMDGGKVLGAYSLVDLGDTRREVAHTLLYGCNYAVRRPLALEFGGFHPDALPEALWRLRGDGETGLSKKIVGSGYKAMYEPAATVHHLVSRERMSPAYLERRAYAQGISDSYAVMRYGGPMIPRYLSALRARVLAAWRASRLADAEARHVLHAQARGYWEGLRFHRRQLRRDPSLRAWVTQSTYLDHGSH
jgi:glycosyltransferase involved in cell wall biosynthesis